MDMEASLPDDFPIGWDRIASNATRGHRKKELASALNIFRKVIQYF